MQITINEEVREFTEGISLEQLLAQLSLQTKGMAVAVNQNVISRENWKSYILQENDVVFIIRATHGG